MRVRLMLVAAALAGAVTGATTDAAADTIHLTGGGRLTHARVVAEHDDTVEIEVRAGAGVARIVVDRAEVERIERDAPDPQATERPADLDRAFGLLRAHKPVEALLLLKPFFTNGRWLAPARYGESLAREQLGDVPAAALAVRLARTLAPNDPWIAFHAAHLLHRQGRFAAAERGYRLAAALEPDNRALKALARDAIAAARAGVAASDPAAGRARATFDPAAGNVAEAAEAAAAVRDNSELVLREAITALAVHCDAPPAAARAYAAGGDVARFRAAVWGVRAAATVGPDFLAAGAADRSLCLRQIHSALAHRYPGAVVVVEARAADRVRAVAFEEAGVLRVVFDPPPTRAPTQAPTQGR